jgi:hypothetical protein
LFSRGRKRADVEGEKGWSEKHARAPQRKAKVSILKLPRFSLAGDRPHGARTRLAAVIKRPGRQIPPAFLEKNARPARGRA